MQEIKVEGAYTEGKKTIYIVRPAVKPYIEIGLEFIPVTTEGEYLYDPAQHLYAKVEKIDDKDNKLICTVYKGSMTCY